MKHELMMTSEAAQECDVVPDTIRQWNRSGKLNEAYRTRNGVRLYRRADIERVARERVARRAGGGVDGDTAA